MIPHMQNPMNEGDDSAVITLTRKKSSAADIVRRNSDTRILGQSDLNLAQRIENIRKKSDTKIIGYVRSLTRNYMSTLIPSNSFHVD